ncbi:MAG: class I SAM-dependent methyltransferase [Syntrophomonadaceae bacterium]|nr:class I SAM-dependent methyltransferase [Syntrophomonadaceae bacterium]
MVNQSLRLKTIAKLIEKGQPTADIGSDHAGLARHLVETGLVPRVIATELGEEPFSRAYQSAGNSLQADKIEVRKGDGLQVLNPGEVTNVIIAGLGGDTITNILANDWQKAASFKRFVFQPMSRPAVIREALCRQGWPIVDEVIIRENNRYFVIIVAVPGDEPYNSSPLEIDLGPIILQPGSKCQSYLLYHLNKYCHLRDSLQKSRQYNELLVETEQKIAGLEAVLYEG